MISPHYISEDKSDMRGIKHGWYAVEDDGSLSSGLFASREECIKRITQPTNGMNDGVSNVNELLPKSNQFSKCSILFDEPTGGHQ